MYTYIYIHIYTHKRYVFFGVKLSNISSYTAPYATSSVYCHLAGVVNDCCGQDAMMENKETRHGCNNMTNPKESCKSREHP